VFNKFISPITLAVILAISSILISHEAQAQAKETCYCQQDSAPERLINYWQIWRGTNPAILVTDKQYLNQKFCENALKSKDNKDIKQYCN